MIRFQENVLIILNLILALPGSQRFGKVSTNGLTLLLGHHPGQVDRIVQELKATQ